MNAKAAGMAIDFGAARPLGLPDVWRDLDAAVWQWVRAHGGTLVLAEVAGWASHADGQGHSALSLTEGMAGLAPGQRDALANDPWVAASPEDIAACQRPFVLDGGHFYLRRNFRQETAVAAALRARRAGASRPLRPLTGDELRDLFNGRWSEAEERQRAAVAATAGRRFMVLTGGPGTGKTTTVLRMLLALSREHEAVHAALPLVRVAAPTGKAAQRLGESLRQGAERLRGQDVPLPEPWLPHLSNVLGAGSGTVHRLLGSRGRLGGFRHHAGHPLPADIVVVDEASMLDLGLLGSLLAALPAEATLLLVGDADQLTSVGTGSVLKDIVEALEAEGSGDFVRLSHCFRADATLVPINETVRAGNPDGFADAWSMASGKGRAEAHEVADPPALRRRLAAWSRRIRRMLEDAGITRGIVLDQPRPLEHALALLRRQQLLCAQREGPFGSLQADQWIAQDLRRWQALSDWSGQAWFPGRTVIVTRNDPASGLFNGDVGICVLVEDARGPRLQIAFEASPDRPGDAHGARLFAPNALPDHEGAFALTVHKSQGSEYGHVAVLLPPGGESPLLTRQTLYTALSRARSSVELWSVEASTHRCINTALRRHGRLAARLRETG